MKTFRVGIVGCGNIARSHVKGYRENGATITAVTDVSRAAAEAVAGETGATVYPDFTAMYSSGTVDVVSICTPPCYHEEAAVAALAGGIHVLLEKPQAHTVAAATAIARAAAASSAVMMIAFRHRFLSATLTMKSLLDTGRIGRPVFFENVFCGPAQVLKDKWFSRKAIAGGGSMLDTSSHSIDLFRFFFGEIVETHGVCAKHWEGTDVEDVGIITVRAADGTLGTLTSAWVAGTGVASIRIMGENGSLFYDYTVPNQVVLRIAGATTPEVIDVTQGDSFAAEIRHFLAVTAGQEKLCCSAEDGLKNLQVVDAVYNQKYNNRK